MSFIKIGCVLGVVVGMTAAVSLSGGAGCNKSSESGGTPDDFVELALAICDPGAGPFTLDIDNEFFPLPPGRMLELEGDEGGTTVGLVIEVTDETEAVAGVTTRVVTETHTEDGEIIEFSRNFFVQAPDGTVCYYGEEVDNIEGGVVINHNGSWRAGEGENLPGIIMPGSPAVETQFAQEAAPGIAEDRSAIVGVDESVTVPAGAFTGVVHTLDWNPLDGQTSADGEDKFFASGVGLVSDHGVELVSVTD
jgi:hypothetical protein